jgi:Rrf2 family transcriptional regulator, nitric oxide-sensitive transcriptional repressor
LCPLHRRLDEAMETVETTFCDTTVADILNEPSNSQPLCAFPPLQQLVRSKPRSI